MTSKKAFPKVLATSHIVTLATGAKARVILLNNAATTPPFKQTLNAVNELMQTYGAMHRGAGPHASITFEKTQNAIKTIRKFFGLRSGHAMLFTQNTSTAINLFSRMLSLKQNDVVLTSSIEHTSNNLPWRYNTMARVVEVNAFEDGDIDLTDLEKKAMQNKENLKLIAFTGASNQTGHIPDIKKLAAIAHANGTLLFIDAAQLAPHRQINMKKQGIDALAFSAHKLYAPFGLGVLVLPKKLLDIIPADPGGGSIDMISEKNIIWATLEERHQTGTWNIAGIIALAESCKILNCIGWKRIIKHEKELISYAVKRLANVPGLTLFVLAEKYLKEDRIGTFPFALKGFHHALLSAILEHEFGIETRAGAICNHKLVRRWFNVSNEKQATIEKEIKNGNRLASYGIVRASIGIHNTKKDIDALANALAKIAKNGPKLKYEPNEKEETFTPIGTN